MSGNPFDDAQGLVGDLQGQYDKLVRAIPKLKATKEVASAELKELNQQVTAAQLALEKLTEQIKQQTAAYNQWQSTKLAELEARLKVNQADFDRVMSTREAEHAKEATQLSHQLKANELAQTDLAQREAKLKKSREAVDDKQAVNDKWAEMLNAREAKIKQQETVIAQQILKQQARTAELSQREAKLVMSEKQRTEDIRRSELDKQTTKKLLDSARESIANNDARQQELELREKFLKTKEADLHKKEIALNDRSAVIATH